MRAPERNFTLGVWAFMMHTLPIIDHVCFLEKALGSATFSHAPRRTADCDITKLSAKYFFELVSGLESCRDSLRTLCFKDFGPLGYLFVRRAATCVGNSGLSGSLTIQSSRINTTKAQPYLTQTSRNREEGRKHPAAQHQSTERTYPLRS